MSVLNFTYVALGGAIGASGRYGLGLIMTKLMGRSFPWATLTANISGGFLMGLLVGWLALRVSGAQHLQLFLAVGVLGGFTTFSSFSLEMANMIRDDRFAVAGSYAAVSVIVSIAAVFAGLMIARKLFAV